jgi:hypothetical protein
VTEVLDPIVEQDPENLAESRSERRGERRVKVDRLVYVRPADADSGHFEEVRSMRDLSRSGFYFSTERNFYRPGTQLNVVPAFGTLNLEYLGEVVRVEKLAGGEFGVAVRLMRVKSLEVGARSNTLAAFQAFARADNSPSVPAPNSAKRSFRE